MNKNRFDLEVRNFKLQKWKAISRMALTVSRFWKYVTRFRKYVPYKLLYRLLLYFFTIRSSIQYITVIHGKKIRWVQDNLMELKEGKRGLYMAGSKFSDLNLSKEILVAIEDMGFEEATTIRPNPFLTCWKAEMLPDRLLQGLGRP